MSYVGSFKLFWPTSSDSRPKLSDGSILVKFLLETSAKLEPFEALDNLLGFQVQKFA